MSIRTITATVFATFVTFFVTLVNTSVFAADFSAPLIDLPRVKSPQSSNSPVTVKAIVDDDVGVSSVKLFYRIVGQSGKFRSIPLKPTKKHSKTYAITLPSEIRSQKGVEYYVEARDNANNVTQEPFPNKPRKIYFRTMASNNNPDMKSRYFKKGLFWGANISYGNFTIDDPDGNTGSIYAPSFAVMMGYAPNGLWRGWADVSYQSFTLPYSQTEIGQDVSSMRLDLIVQRGFPILDSVGWIGAGIGIEKTSSSNRGTEINNTFIDKFGDRDDTAFELIIDFGYELGPIRNQLVGLNGKLYRTLENGLNGLLVGVYISLR